MGLQADVIKSFLGLTIQEYAAGKPAKYQDDYDMEEKIREENEEDHIRWDIERYEELGIPCDSTGNPLVNFHMEGDKAIVD